MKTNISKALKTGSVLFMAIILSFALYFTVDDNSVSAATPRTWVTQVEVSSESALQTAISNAGNNIPTLIKLTGNINVNYTFNIPSNKIIKITSKTGTYSINDSSNHSSVFYNNGELWTENVRIKAMELSTAVDNRGKYIMQNGTVLTDGIVGVMNSSDFEMEGGEITNITSNAVQNIGNFIMRGGRIYNSNSAVYNSNGRTVTIYNCEIYNTNGISNYGGSFVMHNGNIYNNEYAYGGGGIRNHGGTVVINSGIFIGNKGKNGGAISNLNDIYGEGKVTISNAIIINNTASIDGGGIYTVNYSNLTVRNTVFAGNSASVKYTGVPSAGDQAIYNSNISGCSYTSNSPAFRSLYNNYDVNYVVLKSLSARTNSPLISVSADNALGMPSLGTTSQNIQVRHGSMYRPTVSLQYPGLTYSVYVNGNMVISNSTALYPVFAINEDSIIEFRLNDRHFTVYFNAVNRPQGGGAMTSANYPWVSTNGASQCNVYNSPAPRQLLLQDGTSIPFTTSVNSSGHRMVSYTLNPYAWSPAEAAQKGFANDTYRVRVVW